MPKKYKQLKDSWFSSAGDMWEQDKYDHTLYVHQKTQKVVSQMEVDDSPNWFEEEPEKKIVNRWRAGRGHYYEGLHGAMKEDNHTVDDRNFQEGRYFKSESVSDRARKRTEIMCRLMGLAETIEEGSTECKGERWAPYITTGGELYICMKYSGTQWTLATFSTKELAQLFLDSAGQDAIDWYGAVK